MSFPSCLLTLVLTASLGLLSAQHDHDPMAHPTAAKADTVKGSPHRVVMANIGATHVHLEFHSPTVRKRIIWGGLVPYDEVWVTGAHMATAITVYDDVLVAGNLLPKGTYAIFTIPGPKMWTVIFNTNWEQHLTDEYDPKDDVFRFEVKPVRNRHSERLMYWLIVHDTQHATLEMTWEKVKISFPVTIPEGSGTN
ncbi:MAG: DUF2911 domain-containing protein [Bacteroidia bacterium]|nr:DUF2911 domain-containing protein [Bacteroidia bacterium]